MKFVVPITVPLTFTGMINSDAGFVKDCIESMLLEPAAERVISLYIVGSESY